MTVSAHTTCTILHVDMDAFYASIEQRDNPELRGKPVMVGSPPDQRGVIAAASYEARTFGVHSAMPSRTAGKLCPDGCFVPVNMRLYAEVSEQVMEILESFTPAVEQLSVDEAFLDVESVTRLWGEPQEIARKIKDRIRSELDLTASVGVAPNKFLAKLASDLEKPDGLTIIPELEEEIIAFLAPLPVNKIWGVGKKGEKVLHAHGYRTIGDLQAETEQGLKHVLGEAMGEHVWLLAYGEDDRDVDTDWQEKSVSNEHTYDVDCKSMDTVRETLTRLVEKVGRRLRRSGKKGRTGHIKIRFEDFKTITRQRSLGGATNSDRDLLHCALGLFERENILRPVRLVGFGVSDIVDASIPSRSDQPMLFEEMDDDKRRKKEARLDRAVDTVRDEFGTDALKRGLAPDQE